MVDRDFSGMVPLTSTRYHSPAHLILQGGKGSPVSSSLLHTLTVQLTWARKHWPCLWIGNLWFSWFRNEFLTQQTFQVITLSFGHGKHLQQ